MKTMEMSIIAMTKQVDKLCVDMRNAEIRAQGIFPCPLLTFKVFQELNNFLVKKVLNNFLILF
jgi:hypothetical protein